MAILSCLAALNTAHGLQTNETTLQPDSSKCSSKECRAEIAECARAAMRLRDLISCKRRKVLSLAPNVAQRGASCSPVNGDGRQSVSELLSMPPDQLLLIQ